MAKWQYSILKVPRQLSDENLVAELDRAGQDGWEVCDAVIVEGGWHMLAKRPQSVGVVDGSAGERVLFISVHKRQHITAGPVGNPEISFVDCKHLHDARLLEEHPAMCKIALDTGSHHEGSPSLGVAMWVRRKDLRFIGRGEDIPELITDPEESALSKLDKIWGGSDH